MLPKNLTNFKPYLLSPLLNRQKKLYKNNNIKIAKTNKVTPGGLIPPPKRKIFFDMKLIIPYKSQP